MNFTKHNNTFRWIIIIASLGVVSLILWKTHTFFQHFKEEERLKMETWAFAQTDFIDNDSNNNIELTIKILSSNKTTPILVINEYDQLGTYNNIDDELVKDQQSIQKLVSKFKEENKPISVKIEGRIVSTIYYGNSDLLNKLRYYPLALLLIIVLFVAVIFFFYSSNKNATQNKLWSGMAKETAHQIGTPLSSLIGWTEILKSEQLNPEYIVEIEKDIDRLQTITERFSKIGSVPTLHTENIVKETVDAFEYLKARASNLIEFKISVPNEAILVPLNKQLFSWTIENLVKNAIDAMKGRGLVTIAISRVETRVVIHVSDAGKGILRKDFKQIFEPGFTTKARGWGLGLSLSKRIIEDFHGGQLKVVHSEIDKGSTFEITLKGVMQENG